MGRKVARPAVRKAKTTRKGNKPTNLDHLDTTTRDKVEHSEQSFHGFVKLPSELRNRIYQLAMPQGEKYRFYLYGSGTRYPRPPALAHASHQTRAEALPLWRDGNTFYIRAAEEDMDKSLAIWLAKSGTSALEHMHLIIEVDDIDSTCSLPGRVINFRGSARAAGSVTQPQCYYDLVVELRRQKFEVRIKWIEKCQEQSGDIENAFAYGKASGWMTAMGLSIGKNFMASEPALKVQYPDVDEFYSDDEDHE